MVTAVITVAITATLPWYKVETSKRFYGQPGPFDTRPTSKSARFTLAPKHNRPPIIKFKRFPTKTYFKYNSFGLFMSFMLALVLEENKRPSLFTLQREAGLQLNLNP